MKRLLCFLLILGWCIDSVHAQLHLNAKLQNNHLWRGMEVADGIVLLTDFNYSMADNHVTVGLWGGVNSEGSYKEFNHYLSLKAGGWHLDLWDTYNFSPGATYNNKQYWNYSAHETGRFLDMTVGYRFDEKKIPLALSWSTVVLAATATATIHSRSIPLSFMQNANYTITTVGRLIRVLVEASR